VLATPDRLYARASPPPSLLAHPHSAEAFGADVLVGVEQPKALQRLRVPPTTVVESTKLGLGAADHRVWRGVVHDQPAERRKEPLKLALAQAAKISRSEAPDQNPGEDDAPR
jgi:hypothetical protein